MTVSRDDGDLDLDVARVRARLTLDELWMRYFALGGMASPFELEAALQGALTLAEHDRAMLAVAIDERMAELDGEQSAG